MRDKTNVSGLTFQMIYPGKEAYHFPIGVSHESPCMDSYWRGSRIRQGNKKMEDETC